MAVDFMSLLGAMMQGGAAPSAGQRMQNAASSSGGIGDILSGLLGAGSGSQGSGIGDMLSGLFGSGSQDSGSGGLGSLLSGGLSMGQGMLDRAGKAAGGKDNLAAAGVGALLGALTSKNNSTMSGIGGGLMGLLGMMAYKVLTGQGGMGTAANTAAFSPSAAQATPEQQNEDAKLLLIAMADAAKADGQIDQNEFDRISAKVREAGIGQDGMRYVMQLLQSPMATNTIAAAVRGRPEMAVQVYMASLMAIEVDTKAERDYLNKLANAMGLAPAMAKNIEQLMGVSQVC